MDIYETIMNNKRNGKPCVQVTVIGKSGEGPLSVGKKMLVQQDGTTSGTVGGGAIELAASKYAMEVFKTKLSETKGYLLAEGIVAEVTETLPMACGGKATLFYDYIGPKAHVYIFGAGHVGRALAYVLKTMPYYIEVIDSRQDVLEGFENSDEKHLSDFSAFIEKNGLRDDSYVIVCTPSHKYDYDVMHQVISKQLDIKYIGMLCSKTKLNDYLDKTYERFGKSTDLSHFYSPIGLDIGGQSPAEIAISIAAEMLAIEHGKDSHNHMRGDY